MLLPDERGLDAAEQWIDTWHAAIDERAEQARNLTGRLANLTVRTRSKDGLIELTMDRSGTVTDLRLDEGIRGHPAQQTAERILALARAARSALARQVAQATAETMGRDSETARAVIAGYGRHIGTPPARDGHGDL